MCSLKWTLQFNDCVALSTAEVLYLFYQKLRVLNFVVVMFTVLDMLNLSHQSTAFWTVTGSSSLPGMTGVSKQLLPALLLSLTSVLILHSSNRSKWRNIFLTLYDILNFLYIMSSQVSVQELKVDFL